MTFSTKHYRSGKSLLVVLVLGIAVAVSTSATASDPQHQEQTFYKEQKKGWFWYEEPPPEPEPVKPSLVPGKPSDANPYRNASIDDYSMDDLWNMYPDDFQELLNHVQNVAVQSPTEQHILQYLVLQDVARRKALAYANASMYVTQKHNELFNVSQVYPTSKPGVTARVQMQRQEISQTINKAKDNHALLFFTSPTCGFCEKQTGILHYFIDKYGWQVKPVDISRNTKAAARFNIETTPTLLLVKKGEEQYMTVAVGVASLTEIERKLYRSIRHLNGNTTSDNFGMYDFQEGSALDPNSILNKGKQPWKR